MLISSGMLIFQNLLTKLTFNMRSTLTLILCCFLIQTASAQFAATWSERADLNTTLPTSIRVFEDKAIPAYYVRIDLADTSSFVIKSLLASSGSETVSSFATTNKAFVTINGGYFGGTSSYSLIAQNGKVLVPNIKQLNRSGLPYFPTRSAFGIMDRKKRTPDIAWTYEVNGAIYAYPAPSPNKQGTPQPQPTETTPAGGAIWNVYEGIGGGPVLVENGVQKVTWEEEVFFGSGVESNNQDPRSAIGYTADGKLILMVVDGRGSGRGATLPEMAKLMIDLGAVEAMNLDGGGSSTMAIGQTVINKPSDGVERKIPTALAIMPKPKPPAPSADTIIDTGDACCYKESGPNGWFESANTPFHGTTKARLNETGSGSDRATFYLKNLPKEGDYDVSAWWIPSFNRAKDTPFTIYQNGVGTTIKTDQSVPTTAGLWNKLGTFKLAPTDSVVVSDNAKGDSAPSYVVTDGLKLTLKNTTPTERESLPAQFSTFTVFPNPTQNRFWVEISNPKMENVTLEVFDVLGRQILFDTSRFSGTEKRSLSLAGKANGIYYVRATIANKTITRSILLKE